MRLLFIVAVLLLTACATTRENAPPDWVAGVSSKFPDQQYLLGRGQAARRDVATDRARADLAKGIEVQVQAESRDSVGATRQTQDGQATAQLNESIERDIRTTTQQVIRGAKVSDLWQAPQGGDFHALVTLSRAEAARDLRAEIRGHDDATAVAVEQARQADDLLLKIAAAQRAVDEQARRTELQRVLRVVARGQSGPSPKWKLADLQGELAELQSRLKIRVQADDEDLSVLVAGAVTAAGFMTTDDDSALYVLAARFSGGPVEQRQGWYWQRGKLELKLVDRDGNVRGTSSWPMKVSAQEEAVLSQRLSLRMDKTLKVELRSAILGFTQ